jgi:hypothetical protein
MFKEAFESKLIIIDETIHVGGKSHLYLRINFFFFFITENGVPKSSDGSDGLNGVAVFDIIVVCSLAGFLMFGSVYKWKVKGESGVNVIPFREFWMDLPKLVKVNHLFFNEFVQSSAKMLIC